MEWAVAEGVPKKMKGSGSVPHRRRSPEEQEGEQQIR
jgi:hypothetical protein